MKQQRTARVILDDDAGNGSPVEPLALRPREAAAALGISERLLWSMTKSREVPCVRMGRAVVYPVATLKEWLNEKVER